MRQKTAIVVNLGFYILHSGFIQSNKFCQLSNRVMCFKKIKAPRALLSFVSSSDITKGRVQSIDIRADIFFNEWMDEIKATLSCYEHKLFPKFLCDWDCNP